MIATKSPSANVLVFDYTKHPSFPTDAICRPQHRCLGHTLEGYGLSWNPVKEGILLSGSDDGSVCIWDVREGGLEVAALHTWSAAHSSVVEDVDWHNKEGDIFATVGDDSCLRIWDQRTSMQTNFVENAHKSDVNCVSFNPISEFLLATGGTDRNVTCWDLRNLSRKLFDLEGHQSGVYQINWAPFNESVLASCGTDRRVHIWDLSRLGNEQSAEDAEDGPPELLFVHGGHTAKVSDFSWNCHDQWVLASVSEDNILQVWQMVSLH